MTSIASTWLIYHVGNSALRLWFSFQKFPAFLLDFARTIGLTYDVTEFTYTKSFQKPPFQSFRLFGSVNARPLTDTKDLHSSANSAWLFCSFVSVMLLINFLSWYEVIVILPLTYISDCVLAIVHCVPKRIKFRTNIRSASHIYSVNCRTFFTFPESNVGRAAWVSSMLCSYRILL